MQKDLFGDNSETRSIQILQGMEPEEGYYLAFSGGKDSVVLKYLADKAGVKYDAHYSVTTIDPPELVQFIRKEHKDVVFEHPATPLVKMIPKNYLPTRQFRWCCKDYKENGGSGRVVLTGVRAAESARRAQRRTVELCYRGSGKRYVNAILHWSDAEIWEYIKENDIPYCSLYDDGWDRVGCIFCPMDRPKHRQELAERYPKYVFLFVRECDKLVEKWNADTKYKYHNVFSNGQELFDWWLSNESVENFVSDEEILPLFE